MKPELSVVDDIIHLRPKQEVLFNVSNFIGIIVFSYYAFVHWQSGHAIAGLITSAYAGLGALLLVWANFAGNVDDAQNVVLASLIPLFCLVMVDGNPRAEGPIWIIIYPLLAFFYKGRTSGTKWLAALVLALMLVLAAKIFYGLRSPFPIAAFLILIACLLTVAMYVYAYDTIRSEAEQNLKTHTLALDEANRKLIQEIAERQLAQQKVLERTMELSELNQELSETVDKLARLNAEKNELMSMIAHDLRNPLTGVLLAARQLENEDDLALPDNRERIAEVKRSIQYTLKLINNFLGIKAMEAGQTALEIAPYDISAIVAGLTAGYRERAAAKDIELIFQGEPVAAMCDQAAATEVVENLLSNALKFSPPGKQVALSVERQASMAKIKVSDQGPGLSDDDKQKLFKMFTRLSARPTAGEESIGLGLSTTKKLIELMGGRIECESTAGNGATFIVELPLADEGKNA